jgi:hypothetical protein
MATLFDVAAGEVETVNSLHKSLATGTVKKAEVLRPGSRGGLVIGHTRSGKPIYASQGGAAHVDNSEFGERSHGFSAADHGDAAAHHEKHAKQAESDGKYEEAAHHRKHAQKHRDAAGEKMKHKVAKEEGVHPKDVHAHLHSRLHAAEDTMRHIGKLHHSHEEAKKKNKKYARADHEAGEVKRQLARMEHYSTGPLATPFYRSVNRKIEKPGEYTTPGESSSAETPGEEFGERALVNSSTRVGKKTVERKNTSPIAPEGTSTDPKLYLDLGEGETSADMHHEEVPEQPNYGGPGQIRNVPPRKSKRFDEYFKRGTGDGDLDEPGTRSFDEDDMTLKKEARQKEAADKKKAKRLEQSPPGDDESDDPKVAKSKPKLGSGKRFAQLKGKIAARGGVKDPAAVAAAIGRKKYGAKKFQQLAKKSLEQDLAMEKGDVDVSAARELNAYMHNDHDLHYSRIVPIRRNLLKKLKSGTYDHSKAPAFWRWAVDEAAKNYHAEFGRSDAKWHQTFDQTTRNALACHLANRFHAEAKRGEHDHLVKGIFDFLKPKTSAPKYNPTAAVSALGSRYAGTKAPSAAAGGKRPAAVKPAGSTMGSTPAASPKPKYTMAHLQAAKQAMAGQQGKKKASLTDEENSLSGLIELGGPGAMMKSISVLALNSGTVQTAEDMAYYEGGMEDGVYREFRSLLRSLPPKMWAFLKRVADKSMKPQVAIRHIAECIGEMSKSITVYENNIEVVDADMAPRLGREMEQAVLTAKSEEQARVKKNCPMHSCSQAGRTHAFPLQSLALNPNLSRSASNTGYCNCHDQALNKSRLARRACEILTEKAVADPRIENAIGLLGIDVHAMKMFIDTVN